MTQTATITVNSTARQVNITVTKINGKDGKDGTGATILDVTYAELVEKIHESELIKGDRYRITDFATRHFITDGLMQQARILGDTPAPDDIVIMPVAKVDSEAPASFLYSGEIAPGTNAVTYYYSWFGIKDVDGVRYRSLPSDEVVIIVGDDTEYIMFMVFAPADLTGVTLFRGTASGIYTHLYDAENLIIPADAMPVDLINTAPVPYAYEDALALPVYQGINTEDAPGPTNVTVVADAIGDNPVVYYYAACGVFLEGAAYITGFSQEITCTQGDSTTSLIFNCSSPVGALAVLLVRGIVSGDYTEIIAGNSMAIPVAALPFEFFGNITAAPVGYLMAMLAEVPTQQIVIIPDEPVIGANPVSYYYKVVGLTNSSNERSLFSDEIVVSQGDDTQEIVFNCSLGAGLTEVFIFRGTESGVYTQVKQVLRASIPLGILDVFSDEEGSFAEISSRLVYQSYGPAAEVTGLTEPLIVTAISTNQLATEAQSELFPGDKIEYDWNLANWIHNTNFIETIEMIPTIPIAGFKGVITYREDTTQDNSANHDFRNAKNRLWSIAQPEWVNGSYPVDSLVSYINIGTGINAIYSAKSEIFQNEEPSLSPKWRFLWSVKETVYWSCSSTEGMAVDNNVYIPVVDPLDFIDIGIFGNHYSQVFKAHYAKVLPDVIAIVLGAPITFLIPQVVLYSLAESYFTGVKLGYCFLSVLLPGQFIEIDTASYGISLGKGSDDIRIAKSSGNCSIDEYNTRLSIEGNTYGFAIGKNNADVSIGKNCTNFIIGDACTNLTMGNGAGGNLVIPGGARSLKIAEGVSAGSSLTLPATVQMTNNTTKQILYTEAGKVIMVYYNSSSAQVVYVLN